MTITQTPLPRSASRDNSDYQRVMARELLIWLVGVPVPIIAVIGYFVL